MAISFKERAQRLRGVELEYANQRLIIANKMVQVLAEAVQTYQELKETIDAHIKLLQEYKADPEFKKKGFLPDQKSLYRLMIFSA